MSPVNGGPQGAPGTADTAGGAVSRREFLRLAGAAAALGGLEACHPPRERIVPYVRQPPEVHPGLAMHYATAASIRGTAVGLVVTCHEGRPTKVEGNPSHPASLGATGPLEQALILDLYDPARARGFVRRGQAIAWRTLLAELDGLARRLEAGGGERLRFLVGAGASPLLRELRSRLQERFPRARFRAWEPLFEDGPWNGSRAAFGRPLDVRLHLDRAEVVFSLDADFLGADGETVPQARDFASRRVPGAARPMSRLWVAESRLSLTGAAADRRLPMRRSEVAGLARAVAGQLARAHGVAALAPLAPAGAVPPAAQAVARDLWVHRGRSLVVAGPGQPAAVHALAHAINVALGNAGATVGYAEPVHLDLDAGPSGLRDLAAEISAGEVDTLVVTAWNPVFTAPPELDLGTLLSRVPNAVYHALRPDETWERCAFGVAACHLLESWGDARSRDGTASLVQPVIAPLWESVSEAELLAAFLGAADRGGHRLLLDSWRSRRPGPGFDLAWEQWLASGVIPGTAAPELPPPKEVAWAAVAAALAALPPAEPSLEVGFVPDYRVLDGRFAENAWLEELPDPVTKLTWGNAAMLSPGTAERLGIGTGDAVEVRLGGRAVELPALVVAGHADEALTLPLGYGRRAAAPSGREVGADAYRLRSGDAPWFAAGGSVRPTGRRAQLAVTQGHFAMEGRPLALELTLREWAERGPGDLAALRGPLPTIMQPVGYAGQEYRWGMAVDLARCTGCSACVVACQAENNVPVVGRAQVLRGREMHWLRVDRYLSQGPGGPRSQFLPLACVHCEAAPCEYVCPVNATVHSDEGLNEMVYNRCVGTRYCSNNCPYKVRRFNFLSWRGEVAPSERMLMNPDVTVRSRGVMEKCTYCVQRIERARIDSRAQGRAIRDGEARSACEQVCPTQAIVFGNLNDPDSRVARLHQDPRRYDVLHDMGTRPRTGYLARLVNPGEGPA